MGRKQGKEGFSKSKANRWRRRDVWVFTEGEVTEPQYIDILKDFEAPRKRVAVHIANDSRADDGRRGSGRGKDRRKPKDLVAAAIDLKQQKDREAQRADPTGWQPAVVWCFFDRDEHEGVDQAIAEAEKAGVGVAFSHPCFELWRLLHYQHFARSCGGNCAEVAQRLDSAADAAQSTGKSAKAAKKPKKSGAGAEKPVHREQILGGYAKAKAAARRIARDHGDHLPYTKRDPYTDVWRFVEEGLGIDSY